MPRRRTKQSHTHKRNNSKPKVRENNTLCNEDSPTQWEFENFFKNFNFANSSEIDEELQDEKKSKLRSPEEDSHDLNLNRALPFLLSPLFNPFLRIPVHGTVHVSEISIPRTLEPFLVNENRLTSVITILGTGACGDVSLQTMIKSSGEHILVAVKSSLSYNKWILQEAEILSKLKHENVTSILGFVKGNTPFQAHKLVMEYLPIGNLMHAAKVFHKKNMLKFLCDICKGMDYINSQMIVHRDLACRNVFVSSSSQVKIGDFGLSRYVDEKGFYYDEDLRLTGYNISPEALISKLFSSKSDVWAMGILCWELFYYTEMNYLDLKLQLDNQIFNWHSDRLPRSSACPQILYEDIIERCLNLIPKDRPSFGHLQKKIEDIILKFK